VENNHKPKTPSREIHTIRESTSKSDFRSFSNPTASHRIRRKRPDKTTTAPTTPTTTPPTPPATPYKKVLQSSSQEPDFKQNSLETLYSKDHQPQSQDNDDCLVKSRGYSVSSYLPSPENQTEMNNNNNNTKSIKLESFKQTKTDFNKRNLKTIRQEKKDQIKRRKSTPDKSLELLIKIEPDPNNPSPTKFDSTTTQQQDHKDIPKKANTEITPETDKLKPQLKNKLTITKSEPSITKLMIRDPTTTTSDHQPNKLKKTVSTKTREKRKSKQRRSSTERILCPSMKRHSENTLSKKELLQCPERKAHSPNLSRRHCLNHQKIYSALIQSYGIVLM